MNYIFIDSLKDEEVDLLAIIENKVLVEYYIIKKNLDILGNIYRARVINKVEGLKAAFIDIGEEKNAYMPLSPRDRNIKGGDNLLVEVKKDSIGDKGAVVSSDLSFTGKYLVITPLDKRIKVSRKIKNQNEIKRLNKLGKKLVREDIGLVFRTSALGVDFDRLKQEYDQLCKSYEAVKKEKDFLPVPKLLYKEDELSFKIIRDKLLEKDYRITVNDKNLYKNIIARENQLGRELTDFLILDEEFSSQHQVEIANGLNEALSKEVKLKSGGSIVIEETEALTAIDVNTGGNIEYSLEGTVFNTNKEAAIEIARQIRLRNLSGIIIIDFIRLKNDAHMTELIKLLKNEMKKDRNRPYIIGLTELGLLEVTRKRERNPLSQDFFIKCDQCKGLGKIKKN